MRTMSQAEAIAALPEDELLDHYDEHCIFMYQML